MKTIAARKTKGRSASTAGKDSRGRVFKSGNSAALRLPASLGVTIGKSYVLTPTPSGFMATDAADIARRRRGMAALFGSAPDFPLREAQP
jgi:hypothetical protein